MWVMFTSQTEDLKGRDFGEYIRDRRTVLGLSQARVAEAIGLSVSRYNTIELGMLRRLPTPNQMRGLAWVLDVSLYDLLTVAGYYPVTGEKA